jgi:deferrochelatase/peroxidase EfeB
MPGRLQEGIFFRPGERPPGFFAILFLRVLPGHNAREVGRAVSSLWTMYQELKAGRVRDLSGTTVPAGNLTVLVGFGPKAFELPGVGRSRPEGLDDAWLFASALPTGGGPLLRGSGLTYAPEVRSNLATEEFAVQFIADTRLAVERAVVETWKHLSDAADETAPLVLSTFYLGSQRDDGRSWIDFYDGLSNLRNEDRESVIAIDPTTVGEAVWTENGTFLAFVRLSIDLAAWRGIGRADQELVVGRDKLTGCPIVSVEGGRPVVPTGCPVAHGDITDPDNPFRETVAVSDPVVRRSHIQRANHHVDPASDPSSLRLFRQGYAYLEWQQAAPGFQVGLNFVSFQDAPSRLVRVLTTPDWLGHTNFGGDPATQPPALSNLLSVHAAGIYFAPPVVDDEAFPGASVLMVGG